MTLSPGTRLGPYEIAGPLGAGGMGEVYRARDTRLGRDVAVKILPAHLSANAEARERFEREARAISSLNHPHICTLFDVGEHEETGYLVMELVEGETLAERLERGPMKLDEALRVAAQIADALDKAHRQGIVHRDLKPGNVMLTKTGAKILDFGVAKLRDDAVPEGTVTGVLSAAAPTRTTPLTSRGSILGTMQYMAPEQLEGKPVDHRADLFSFGAMLHEMVTGKRAFDGASQASVIAAILTAVPRPASEITSTSPASLDRVIRRCLAKDPDDRWQNARDIALELREVGVRDDLPGTGVVAKPAKGGRLGWIVAAAAMLLVAACAYALWRERAIDRIPAVHLALFRPASTPLTWFGGVEVSPDGATLVFPGEGADGRRLLYVRPIASAEARALDGTEGADQPFWSPDGRHVAFFAEGKLKRIPVAGGPPQTLCEAREPCGGSWGSAGTIVFGWHSYDALWSVPEGGGTPKPVTKLAPKDEAHRWPSFLPDGRHFVFLADARRTEDHWLRIGSIDGDETMDLLQAAITNPVFAAPDRLFYVRGGALLAQRFDPRALRSEGEPVPVARQIAVLAKYHRFEFSASASGVLVYRAASPLDQLAWFDRQGRRLADAGKPDRHGDVALSPDGRLVAYSHLDADGRNDDLFVLDTERGVTTRLTSDPASDWDPVWSPAADRIAFASYRTGGGSVFVTSLSGSAGDAVLHSDKVESWPTDWSADGQWLLLAIATNTTQDDVWAAPLDRPDQLRPVAASPGSDGEARFSPDARWVAFTSDQSGRPEIYVQDFPAGQHRRQVSAQGGSGARWRSDGREILFQGPGGAVMSAAVRPGGALEFDAPRALFTLASGAVVDVARDGQRFLVAVPVEDPATAPIHVVLDWRKEALAR